MLVFEKGRSTIEILAVLFILSLLSFGAIKGINSLFAKNKANQIVQDVKFVAWTIVFDKIYDKMVIGKDYSLDDFNYHFSLYQKMTITKKSDDVFLIHLFDITHEVCLNLLDIKPHFSLAIFPNYFSHIDTSFSCLKEDNNEISYFFTIPFGKKIPFIHDKDNPEENNERCVPSCGSCSICQNGICVENDICTGGQFCSNGECICPSELPYWDGNSCLCYPNEFQDKNGACYLCDTENEISSTEDECKKCSSIRYWSPTSELCYPNCIGEKIRAQNGSCVACYYDGPISTSEEQCDLCPTSYGRFYLKNRCMQKCTDTSFRATDTGNCQSCSNDASGYKYETTFEECQICKNLNYNWTYSNGYCYAGCPSGKMQTTTLSCVYCMNDGENYDHKTSQAECKKCIDYGAPRKYENGVCKWIGA